MKHKFWFSYLALVLLLSGFPRLKPRFSKRGYSLALVN